MEYVHLSVLAKMKEPPPFFIGSQLRGGFGHALKKTVCINPSFHCEGCFGARECLYYDFYEKKGAFHDYRFDFQLGFSYYDFSLYLFKEAARKLPYVLSALHRLLTQQGLGPKRECADDAEYFINGESVYKEGEFALPREYIQTFQNDTYCPDVTLRLHTPLRIKKQNRYARPQQLEAKDILLSIQKRAAQLGEWEPARLDLDFETVDKQLEYTRLMRYSNRQKTAMKFDGVTGQMRLRGLDRTNYELLRLGELIGAGKSTVFGLGKIEIEHNSEEVR